MGAPSTPTNLTLQTANRQNYLSWDQSVGADTYIVQRSLDNVTFSTIATITGTPLNAFYQDIAVLIGVQYWYQVAASNISGVSAYASPTSNSMGSLVPAPTSEMSLATLRRRSQEKADRVNSPFVSTGEWNAFISLALYELYDLLIDVYKNYNIAAPANFQTNGQQYMFPLPDGALTFTNRLTGSTFIAPPFYRLLGLDLAINTAQNAWVSMGKFNFQERNDYVYPNSNSTIYGVWSMRAEIVGSNLMIIPTPSATQTISIWYIPRLPEMVADTDYTDGLGISGWLQYAIVRAGKYALDKEESDTTKLDAELIYLKGRIEESAINRDAGIPPTIQRVRGFSGTNGRDGASWNGASFGGW